MEITSRNQLFFIRCRYLIVSRVRSTLILEVGDEMVESMNPPFITSEPTVAAGELADGALVVQVVFIAPIFYF